MKPFRELLPLVLLLTLPAVVQAQFIYTAAGGRVTITGYTGLGGGVIIPDTINSLPVTSIGIYAFEYCTNQHAHRRTVPFQRPGLDQLSRPLLPHPFAVRRRNTPEGRARPWPNGGGLKGLEIEHK